MSHDLSPEGAQYLERAIKNGIYRNERQALDEAVGLLKLRDSLRKDVNAGISQGAQGQLIASEEVFERLETRACAIENAARASEEEKSFYAISRQRSGRYLRIHCAKPAADGPSRHCPQQGEVQSHC